MVVIIIIIIIMSAKYTKQMRQTLKSIVTSNQSSTTPFRKTSKYNICITSGHIWTVGILLEIIQDVFF